MSEASGKVARKEEPHTGARKAGGVRVKTKLAITRQMTTGRLSESESRPVVPNSLRPHGLHSPWNSPGQNTAVGSLSLLQGIFPTQESNQGLLHCRRILYQLNYQGSPERGFTGKENSEITVSLPAFPTKENIS